jgi:hypothetical protein
VNAEKQKIFDEGLLTGLLSSGRAVLVKTTPFFESKGLTSISLFDPATQRGYTFDISNVRVEKSMEDEEE